MNRDDKFEQPLMLQPECVDCKWYDGFGQCLEHGNHLKDNCEDFEVCCEKEHALRLCEINKRDMTQARKLLQKCCERCTEWSSTDACEDHITSHVFQLYVLAAGKEKVKYVKSDVWATPPTPRPEMQ